MRLIVYYVKTDSSEYSYSNTTVSNSQPIISSCSDTFPHRLVKAKSQTTAAVHVAPVQGNKIEQGY